MKLTITNYPKMIGQRLGVDKWLISDINESADLYSFLCREENSPHMVNVRLERDGFREGNQWKFKYWTPPGYGTSQITVDWFADMGNASVSIANELQKLL